MKLLTHRSMAAGLHVTVLVCLFGVTAHAQQNIVNSKFTGYQGGVVVTGANSTTNTKTNPDDPNAPRLGEDGISTAVQSSTGANTNSIIFTPVGDPIVIISDTVHNLTDNAFNEFRYTLPAPATSDPNDLIGFFDYLTVSNAPPNSLRKVTQGGRLFNFRFENSVGAFQIGTRTYTLYSDLVFFAPPSSVYFITPGESNTFTFAALLPAGPQTGGPAYATDRQTALSAVPEPGVTGFAAVFGGGLAALLARGTVRRRGRISTTAV